MDSPIDKVFDLGLVNYVPHPSSPDHVVFRFADEKRALDFEKSLKNKNIWFERGEEERPARTYYLFAVKNKDFEAAQTINFQVEGRNRKFIVGNKILRWALVIFGVSVITLALVGYCSNPH